MAKEENKVVEEVQPTEEVKTESKKVDEPVLQEGGDMKIKSKPKKPKQLGKQDNSVAKVDLSKAKEETKAEEETVAKVDLSKKEEEPKQEEEVVEEVVEEQPK